MTSLPESRWRFGLRWVFVAVLAAAVVVFVTVSAYTAWHFAAIGAQAQRIEIGMSKAEVQQRIGRPADAIDGASWAYFWDEVVIHFDEAGRVTRIEQSRPITR